MLKKSLKNCSSISAMATSILWLSLARFAVSPVMIQACCSVCKAVRTLKNSKSNKSHSPKICEACQQCNNTPCRSPTFLRNPRTCRLKSSGCNSEALAGFIEFGLQSVVLTDLTAALHSELLLDLCRSSLRLRKNPPALISQSLRLRCSPCILFCLQGLQTHQLRFGKVDGLVLPKHCVLQVANLLFKPLIRGLELGRPLRPLLNG
mmetsp:Transcript_56622/g.184164  ORF Transcript_56622/g.184164 Transcript_56622/m.184164 type:complete len:206 (+) Transcript_56622:591-1208(+)